MDSTAETLKHIQSVCGYMLSITQKLTERAQNHDQSKLEPPEKEMFDEWTPRPAIPYGGEGYNGNLEKMRVAIKHHHESNRHHPEHHDNGFWDMSLLDLVEMMADWKAASIHNDNDLTKSISVNEKRHDIPPYLVSILNNTVKEMKW